MLRSYSPWSYGDVSTGFHVRFEIRIFLRIAENSMNEIARPISRQAGRCENYLEATTLGRLSGLSLRVELFPALRPKPVANERHDAM